MVGEAITLFRKESNIIDQVHLLSEKQFGLLGIVSRDYCFIDHHYVWI